MYCGNEEVTQRNAKNLLSLALPLKALRILSHDRFGEANASSSPLLSWIETACFSCLLYLKKLWTYTHSLLKSLVLTSCPAKMHTLPFKVWKALKMRTWQTSSPILLYRTDTLLPDTPLLPQVQLKELYQMKKKKYQQLALLFRKAIFYITSCKIKAFSSSVCVSHSHLHITLCLHGSLWSKTWS